MAHVDTRSLPAYAATVASVNASAVNTTLKAANSRRRGLIVYNAADKDLYLKLGATASLSSYTIKIAAEGGCWEMPIPIYTGVIDVIWAADPTGSAKVTELT